ncbi:hypothetical protein [Guillardia theta]|uniref:tRNA-intron lyase n=1 Tax=Guillardia theta TaxID=55529 RepID=Q9AW44_GUITH|nr:hypothetical protein GTHECHR2154 [Guillardia theta]CAC27026.1 hypothetical protein [Guillardia theta]|mmetsp:Transcript_17293/g.57213  ORF Transcript_17293/g.57213 Transcript_17293/m.57213 type:complete len:172 (-) Transcript_17293:3748-4263(-)
MFSKFGFLKKIENYKEYLLLNHIDIQKKLNTFIIDNFNLFSVKDIILLFFSHHPEFIWNYFLYRKFNLMNSNLKSGIKFGGNFLIYKYESRILHNHSKFILRNSNENFFNEVCKICNYNINQKVEKFQNESRLANQVSKKFIYINIDPIFTKNCFNNNLKIFLRSFSAWRN